MSFLRVRLHVRPSEVHSHRPGGHDHPKRTRLWPEKLHRGQEKSESASCHHVPRHQPRAQQHQPAGRTRPREPRTEGSALSSSDYVCVFVCVCLPHSCCVTLRSCTTATSPNWSSSPGGCWSRWTGPARFSRPSSWTSLSAPGTETASGSRTDRAGESLPDHDPRITLGLLLGPLSDLLRCVPPVCSASGRSGRSAA